MSKQRTPVATAPTTSVRPQERPAGAAPETFHTTQRGDSLWRIAAALLGDGNRWPEIAEANGLSNPDHIRIGQVLQIPIPAPADPVTPDPAVDAPTAAAADAPAADAPVDAPAVQSPAEAPGTPAPASSALEQPELSFGMAQDLELPPGVLADIGASAHELGYVVQRGDTLWSIAEHYYDDPARWTHIYAANGLSSDRLAVGQQLMLTDLPSRALEFSFDADVEPADMDWGAFASPGPVVPSGGDPNLTGDGAWALAAAESGGDVSVPTDDYAAWEELPLPTFAQPPTLAEPSAADTAPHIPSSPEPDRPSAPPAGFDERSPEVMAEAPSLQTPSVDDSGIQVPGADTPVQVGPAPGPLQSPETETAETTEAPDMSALDGLLPESEGQYVITDHQALIRSAPPELASTGQSIDVGMQVDVIGRGQKGSREYFHVVTADGCIKGWTLAGNAVPAKAVDPSLAAGESDQIPLEGLSGLDRAVANIYNLNGAYLTEQTAGLGCTMGVAVAILYVESNGKSFSNDGRMIIRFENHYFRRMLGDGRRAEYDAHFTDSGWKGDTHRYRDSPEGEWQSVHGRGQSGEHRVLELARSIDDDAALQSISMGAGQTMGSHYATKLGYETPQEMWEAFDSGVQPQLDGVFDYIRNTPRCRDAVKVPDFEALALGYNGSKALEHGYHTKLSQAAAAFDRVNTKVLAPQTSPRPEARPAVT